MVVKPVVPQPVTGKHSAVDRPMGPERSSATEPDIVEAGSATHSAPPVGLLLDRRTQVLSGSFVIRDQPGASSMGIGTEIVAAAALILPNTRAYRRYSRSVWAVRGSPMAAAAQISACLKCEHASGIGSDPARRQCHRRYRGDARAGVPMQPWCVRPLIEASSAPADRRKSAEASACRRRRHVFRAAG